MGIGWATPKHTPEMQSISFENINFCRVLLYMVHISPWAATEGLMAGAERLLASGAVLFLYGPYRRAGVPTAPSNEAFDANLRSRDPSWGLRNLEDVAELASQHRFALEQVIEMPANNLSVIFRRT